MSEGNGGVIILTAGKQIITEDKAADDDNEGKQSMPHKQHDRHADSDPE